MALLLLWAGLFIQIPFISAQEDAQEDISPLRAAEQALVLEETGDAASAAAGPSVWTVVRMVLSLALAAAAVYGVVYFVKRSSKRNVSNDPFLKVLASAHLGSNRYAHIIAVGTKAWVLGSSDGGVNLIGEVDDKDVLNAMLLEDSAKSAAASQGRFPDFFAMLRRFGMPVESRIPGAGDIRKRRERLKGL